MSTYPRCNASATWTDPAPRACIFLDRCAAGDRIVRSCRTSPAEVPGRRSRLPAAPSHGHAPLPRRAASPGDVPRRERRRGGCRLRRPFLGRARLPGLPAVWPRPPVAVGDRAETVHPAGSSSRSDLAQSGRWGTILTSGNSSVQEVSGRRSGWLMNCSMSELQQLAERARGPWPMPGITT